MSHCHPCWCPVSIAVYVIVVSVFSSVVAIVVSVVTIVVNVVTIVVSVVAIVVSVVAIVATVVTIVATVVTIVATVVTIISNVLVSDSLSVLVLTCSVPLSTHVAHTPHSTVRWVLVLMKFQYTCTLHSSSSQSLSAH